jgi:two-component system cell cycle sensor histidine kinase/response regulator CckA
MQPSDWPENSSAIGVSGDAEHDARLLQMSKMEAVGRLAGGVAHDFNNLLTAILGYTNLVLDELGPAHPSRPDVEQIQHAAESAASLTRQLLAFSRRQVLQPEILDLNLVVGNIESLLRRLIGEQIQFVTDLAPTVGHVNADQGQLEQVLMNLAINARDAMAGGGRLTIATRDVTVTPDIAKLHRGLQPGDYVLLEVGDTGSGMDAHVLAHLFEPFFTTKKRGQGTGLGLATVYGIIKQSNGYVWGESLRGRGTKFHIYLPQVPGRLGGAESQQPAVPLQRGTAAILVVDDEPMIRALARRALELYGYEVFEAEDGEAALEVMRSDAGERVNLAVLDVVMPGMDGRELEELLRRQQPRIGVLYISGHTGDELARRLLLDASVPFLQKPFPPDELVERVQEILALRAQSPR